MRRLDRFTGGVISAPTRSGKIAGPLWGLLLALVYFASAKLGLKLAFSNESVTAVWPPTGIALAALVLWGRSLWPGVLLGAFLANVTTDVPVYTAAGIAVGNTLEAVVGATLLERFGFRPALPRLRDIFALVVLAGFLSTAVSATIGVASLSVGDSLSGSALSAWRVWWLGDMGGVLLVASLIFVLVTHWPYRDLPGKAAEALALLAALVGIGLVVFTHHAPAAYLTFPIIVWAAPSVPAAGRNRRRGRARHPRGRLHRQRLGAVRPPLAGRQPPPGSELLGHRGPDRPDSGDRHLSAQAGRAPGAASGARPAGGAAASSAARDPAVRDGRVVPRRNAGQEAGGDFYDVFKASPGRWVAAIGDVCGKGPESASLTALARYTLRAVSHQATGPSEALRLLNAAILEQRSDHRFMTAVLVQLDLTNGDHGVALSNGGHPASTSGQSGR